MEKTAKSLFDCLNFYSKADETELYLYFCKYAKNQTKIDCTPYQTQNPQVENTMKKESQKLQEEESLWVPLGYCDLRSEYLPPSF